MFRLQRLAAGEPVESTWADAVEAVSRARREFYQSAKRDIGIAAGDASESYEWQLAKLIRRGDDHRSAGEIDP